MQLFVLVASLLMLLSVVPCVAADDTAQNVGLIKQHAPLLVSDEPNTLGIAKDGYESEPYMDFNLSVRYPLRYVSRISDRENITGLVMPYLALDGRMSQYFNRRSAPVVTKRFNPKVMFRTYESEAPQNKTVWVDDSAFEYHDIGYAHESNGQYVNTPSAFDAVAANFSSTGVAQDYIHRGWDYLDYRRHVHLDRNRIGVLDIEFKYFLNHGLAQRDINETYPWEAPRAITHIGQVDGIRLRAGIELNEQWFKNASISWVTGYRKVGRYNTARIESSFTPLSSYLGLPVILWLQTGYDNSVARFYWHSWYAGMAFSFETMD